MDWKTPHCKDVTSLKTDPWVQCNSYQKHSKHFCRHRQPFSKIYMESKGLRITKFILQKKKKKKKKVKGEESVYQILSLGYTSQECVVLAEN